MKCYFCSQPLTIGDAINSHNPAQAEHATRRDCIRATARKCAEIASDVSNSYHDGEFPNHHAVGAETVAVTIRKAFALEPKP